MISTAPTISPVEDISEPIYAGLWQRTGAMLLDLIFLSPVLILIQYVNSLGAFVYFYTIIPNLVFAVWYDVYLPKRYGGTPGKLLSGIRITRLDGQAIDWKEAILRHSVNLALMIFFMSIMINGLLKVDNFKFSELGWQEQYKYILALSPMAIYFKYVSNIWNYSELVVLLTNRKRRGIHDFIAGTVVVKSGSVKV